MKPTETVQLVTYISQGCPQQAIDEFTADVWHDLLGEYELAECIDAARAVMRRQPFVAPSEIITEVTAARRAAAGKRRRAMLDTQQPLVAIAARPGYDSRLTREEIDRIFSDVTSRIGRPPARKPPATPSTADIEAERRRQLAALDVLIEQDAATEGPA